MFPIDFEIIYSQEGTYDIVVGASFIKETISRYKDC